MRLLAIVFSLLLAFPAAAQLYVCKTDGRMSFTSQPIGDNCRLQKSSERTNQAAAPAAPAAAAPPPAKPPKGKYPVVSAATQKIRDQKRADILFFELRQEEKRREITYAQIKEANQADDGSNDYLLNYLDKQLHIQNQNITAIQQEISRL